MAFSCETLCRACMEPFSGNSMPLINKKKKRKTPICKNFEDLTNLKVKENDQLPQQLCLGCVSDLNKCFAFREKCVRTNSTLKTYLDLSDSEEDSDDQPILKKIQPAKKSVKHKIQEETSKEDYYEEIEVTQEMVDNAKSLTLEMEEITNLLNPTATSQVVANDQNPDDSLVFIIQDCTDSQTSARFETQKSLDENSETKEKSDEKLKCEICKMEFVRKKNFDNHIKRFHKDSTDEASANKKLRLSLVRGVDNEQIKQELQENPEAKKCKICGALYLNEKSLRIHEKKNACLQEAYECDVCKKIFTDQNLFTEHTESHPQQQLQQDQEEQTAQEPFDPLKKFPCTMCPKAFKMLSTLKDHLRTHTGDKPYKCSICQRGFSQNTNLKQHLRRHTQIKPFKCNFDDCLASFVSKGELDSHVRKHTGAHPFSCEQCGAKFTTSSSLVKHRRIHSGERPYQCEFCPMRFTALGTLRNHIRTHTGEKPHKCLFCERSFTQKSDLSAHMRTHTNERPFKCDICDSAFHQSGTLKVHMKVHKNSIARKDRSKVEEKKSE